jgi:hypothetical protein
MQPCPRLALSLANSIAELSHTRSIPKNERLHKLIGKLEGLEQSHQVKLISSATNKNSTKKNNGNTIKVSSEMKNNRGISAWSAAGRAPHNEFAKNISRLKVDTAKLLRFYSRRKECGHRKVLTHKSDALSALYYGGGGGCCLSIKAKREKLKERLR